jgi:hypothetical protein
LSRTHHGGTHSFNSEPAAAWGKPGSCFKLY